MKYMVLGLIMAMFSACGGTHNDNESNIEISNRPSSPEPKEISKQPPSIPTLD